MTETSPIVEFLAAQHETERRGAEAAAKRAGTTDGIPDPDWRNYGTEVVANGGVVATGIEELDPEIADFIVEHSPARVLADIAAKQSVVNHCAVMLAHAVPGSAMAQLCMNILDSLAAPYAKHADPAQ